MDVYLSEQMYEGQEEKTKVVLVDTARYLLKVDDRSDEIHTGADGEWGFFSEVYHKKREHRISDAVIITIAVPDDKDFTAMREMARYFFQDMEPLVPEKHRIKRGPER